MKSLLGIASKIIIVNRPNTSKGQSEYNLIKIKLKNPKGEELNQIKLSRKALQGSVVSTEEGEKFAKEQDLLYYEVTVKEGTNVQTTFKNLNQKLLGPVSEVEQQHTELTQTTQSMGMQLQAQPQTPQQDQQQKCQC